MPSGDPPQNWRLREHPDHLGRLGGGTEGDVGAQQYNPPTKAVVWMEDIEEQVDDEELTEEPEELDEGEASEDAVPPPRDPEGEDVESIEDLLVKKEARAEEDDDEDSVLSLSRDERLEPLAVKVIPPQPTEFVCKKCYLVKHRSQLADRTRMLCRDCA